ncbi:YheC/YheD family protein [Paenibacillus sp. RC67]|uniref:YheC/YheD family endospore coat-associated protein n=1 Tax=Paenibacillus sp. RC67 TaxID=3039392 RepID=UPI0024AD3ED6|nr:YheC/YheD family protein [Paenibacillus sp. RC67]
MYLKKINHAESDCLLVSNDFYRRLAAPPKAVKVHLGGWSRLLKVKKAQSLPAHTIGISSKSLEGLSLPNLKYKIIIKGNNVHIGPVIGIVGFKPGERISKGKLKSFNDYLRSYEQIKGLVYICRADDISIKPKKIKGYFYSRQGTSGTSQWTYGTFPYPTVLYRRAELKPTTYQALSQVLGSRMFNGYFLGEHFNKWDLWKWLSPNQAIRKHLPNTRQLHNRNDLDEMLSRYGAVYLKPTMDQMSRGIVKVAKSNKGYQFIFPENNKKESAYSIKHIQSKDASRFLSTLMQKRNYIVQQAIDIKRFKQRGIDFRVIMQKNERLHWSCTAIIGRFGKRNGIVTNFTNAGYATDALSALQKAYGLSKNKSLETYERMVNICIQACKIFESKGGNYADVGLDMMLDTKGDLWLLEINILPDHKLALYAKKKTLYLNQVAKPLLYANALAGFKSSN